MRVDPIAGIIDMGAYELQALGPVPPLVVSTLVDESDGFYGPGDLSLREAIGLANGNVGFAEMIMFAPALAGGTILLNELSGELVITEGVTISTAGLPGGVTINAGNGADGLPATGDGLRIFNIDDLILGPTIFVGLTGLTLTGGDPLGPGGAINSTEMLTVTDCTVTGNATTTDGGNGGGINSTGLLTVVGSTISGNSTAGDFAFGGGIASMGAAVVINSTVSGNSTTGMSVGGGIFAIGSLSVTSSTIAGNSAFLDGGGISIGGTGSTLTINSSTISGNVATMGSGGGVSTNTTSATVTIDSSTISGNTAGTNGGGIAVWVPAGSPSSISRSTITDNTAGDSGGGISAGMIPGRTLPLNHTIVAENSAGFGTGPDIYQELTGTITSTYSLIGDSTGAVVVNVGGSSLVGTAAAPIDPMLGALADNGGPTMTHALLPGSVAINSGDSTAMAGAGGVPMFDQRGAAWARVIGGTIDIGAVEFQPLPPAFFGDYNLDGFVDAADFIVWRSTFGMVGVTPYSGADGDGDGTIDDGDRLVWRSNFGTMVPAPGSGRAAAETGVPACLIEESPVTSTSPTNLAAAKTDADNLREKIFAAFESSAVSQKFSYPLHRPIHSFENGNPGNDDLLLIAIENAGRFMGNEVCAVEHDDSQDFLAGTDHQAVFDEPLALSCVCFEF
jgi:hypothetical protein